MKHFVFTLIALIALYFGLQNTGFHLGWSFLLVMALLIWSSFWERWILAGLVITAISWCVLTVTGNHLRPMAYGELATAFSLTSFLVHWRWKKKTNP